MKILILEDEKHNASRLKRILLESNPDVEILGILETVKISVEWLRDNPAPDVILMDIRLADGLSFDIFSQTTVTCPVIFTTAYDEYAVRAFKVNSLDYLLKPIDKDELQQALVRVNPVKNNYLKMTDIQIILEQFQQSTTSYRRRFLIPVHDGYMSVGTNEISFIYSEFKLTHLFLDSGKSICIQQTLDELEEELDPELFFRGNRQIILSVDSIDKIYNSFNGKLKIILKKDNQKEVFISREKAPLFKAWLDK